MIARTLVGDIKEIAGEKSARGLAVRFDPHTIHPRHEDGKESDSGNWRKVELGDHLPSTARLGRVTTVYPHADRVAKSLLWPAVDIQARPPVARTGAEILEAMPSEIYRILFEPHFLMKNEWWPRATLTKWDLLKLTRIGTPDALAAQLALLMETPTRLTSLNQTALRGLTFRTLVDLLVFTPFFEVRIDLYRYVLEHHLEKPLSKWTFAYPEAKVIDGKTRAERAILEFMHDMGLVDNSFRQQRLVLYYLQQLFSLDSLKVLTDFLSPHFPDRVRPTDPIYGLLKRMRHPATRYNETVFLPYRRKWKEPFRIANACDP